MPDAIIEAQGKLPVARHAVSTTDAGQTHPQWHTYAHACRLRFDVAKRRLENDHVLVYATNLPGAYAQEADLPSALRAFREVLAAVLAIHQEEGRPIPFERVEMEPGDELCASVEVDA